MAGVILKSTTGELNTLKNHMYYSIKSFKYANQYIYYCVNLPYLYRFRYGFCNDVQGTGKGGGGNWRMLNITLITK